MNVVILTHFDILTLADLEEAMEWVASLGPNKYLNLYEGDFASVDADVRAVVSSADANQFTIADAFVRRNIADRMVGNFYMKYNQPVKPSKEFDTREEAIDWLYKQKEIFNRNI